MVRPRITVAALLVSSFAMVGCSSATDSANPSPSASEGAATLPAGTGAAFQQILDDARNKFGFPGAQAGVWTEDGEWISVTGVSAQGGDQPPQRDDHTRIGSITKTFTSAVVLRLADQGTVGLDDPIDKYVRTGPHRGLPGLLGPVPPTPRQPAHSADQRFLARG